MNILAISKATWDRFTPEQQATIQQAAEAVGDQVRTERLAEEDELVDFFKSEGLDVYTPNLDAFRTRVQKMYLESDLAKDWPEGMVERINAIN
jgi:TRAP-type C4-dicarboxylate transport system substrate-binding protein